MAEPRKTATSEQLRHAIDRGKTGSKLPYPDPAAAPLGTDDEAGGAPTDPGVLHDVLQRETRSAAAHSGVGASANAAIANRSGFRYPLLWLAVVVLVAVIIGVALRFLR